MQRQINIELLKEYIKTLVVTNVVFPDVLPRQWDNDFSRTEIQAIYLTLKFVLLTGAGNQTKESLVKALKQVEEPNLNLHWFLYEYWEIIVPILTRYPNSSVPIRKPSLQYQLN